jgi:inorganic phosphate transporter, PiT family
MSTVVIVTIVVALAFDVLNGAHDGANSIATVVSTRVLSPRVAVLWAAVFNFVALLFFHEGVAKTISGIVDIQAADPAYSYVVMCGMFGAISWNLLTWLWGLPSSSSHALIGGISGAGLAYGGWKTLVEAKLISVLYFILLAPVIGFILGSLLMLALFWIFRRWRPSKVDRTFRIGSLLSAAAYSIGHGGNDAQKTMGIILAVMIAGGYMPKDFDSAPLWVLLSSYACMALGTGIGGWRIIKTMGMGLTDLKPIGGFCSQLAGAATLFFATYLRIPVSTTHTITGAILGVGSMTKVRGVRWGVATRIIWAWIFTIPAAGAVGAFCFWIAEAIHPW